MSGAEVVVILGAISSVISIIEATTKIYQASQDSQGLHEALKRVAASLPLVLRLLEEAKQEIVVQTSWNGGKDVELALECCRHDAETIQNCFKSLLPRPTDSVLRRWSQAVKTARPGKQRKVQEAFKSITVQLQLLHHYSFIRSRDDVVRLQSTANSLTSRGTRDTDDRLPSEPECNNEAAETRKGQARDHIPKFCNLGSQIYNQSDGQWIQTQDLTISGKPPLVEDTPSMVGLLASKASPGKFQNIGSTIGNQGDNQRIGKQTIAF